MLVWYGTLYKMFYVASDSMAKYCPYHILVLWNSFDLSYKRIWDNAFKLLVMRMQTNWALGSWKWHQNIGVKDFYGTAYEFFLFLFI